MLNRNPVHAALSLVATLFGIAVLFIAQEANFLAAVQVIVYAGAIVVLFLFVLMLLGVDRAEDLSIEPLGGQRSPPRSSAGVLALPWPRSWSRRTRRGHGRRGRRRADRTGSSAGVPDIDQLGESLFTDYLFAFEVTSVLLVIAVVGAVVLARKVKRDSEDPLGRRADGRATDDADRADDGRRA